MSTPVPTYLVVLNTPNGTAELEVPTFAGPEAAGRRAFWTACSLGWGDVEEITVESSTLLDSPATEDNA